MDSQREKTYRAQTQPAWPSWQALLFDVRQSSPRVIVRQLAAVQSAEYWNASQVGGALHWLIFVQSNWPSPSTS
jgi:hypothetical protein